MSKLILNYTGGIADKDKKRNFTGSQTIVNTQIGDHRLPRVVIDTGLNQGINNANKVNEELEKDAVNADILVITHAHTDHNGLVPYLVKSGFSGEIIMTMGTLKQSEIMWQNYIDLTRLEQEKIQNLNNKLYKKLYHNLQIVKHYENLDSKDKNIVEESKSYLMKKGLYRNIEQNYFEATSILEEFEIKGVSDIQALMKPKPKLLFDEQDIELTLSKIQTLEIGDKYNIRNIKTIKGHSYKTIDEILSLVDGGHSADIPVDSLSKAQIIGGLRQRLADTIKTIQANEAAESFNKKESQSLYEKLNFTLYYKNTSSEYEGVRDKYAQLTSTIDIDTIDRRLSDMSTIEINGVNISTQEYKDIVKKLGFTPPRSMEDFLRLKKQLGDHGIIDSAGVVNRGAIDGDYKQETIYNNRDIKKGIENSIVTNLETNIDINDIVLFADTLDYDSETIVKALHEGKKRVYMTKGIYDHFKSNQASIDRKIKSYLRNIVVVDDGFNVNDISIEKVDSAYSGNIYNIARNHNSKSKIYVIDKDILDQVKDELKEGIRHINTLNTNAKKGKEMYQGMLNLYENIIKNYDIIFDSAGNTIFWNNLNLANDNISKSDNLIHIRERINSLKSSLDSLGDYLEKNRAEYLEVNDYLEKKGVSKFPDITNKLLPIQPINYSTETIKKAISQIRGIFIDKNKAKLERASIEFFEAGHIEGSVQVLLSIISSQINQIIDTKTKIPKRERSVNTYNIGFSGDLGRLHDPNVTGMPENIPVPLDYYQIESTYGDRNHSEKLESIAQVLSEIDSARGKVIIPTFSIRRTQEILLMLLSKKLESIDLIKKISSLEDEIRELLSREKVDNNLISKLKKEITKLRRESFDYDIILDSPTGEAITDSYMKLYEDKYSLLTKEEQIAIFGKSMITYVESKYNREKDNRKVSIDDLYTEDRKNRKEIIVSSSGMADGGAITNHLMRNLDNPKSKIVFVGYTPPSTNGGKIKSGQKNLLIEGEIKEINCEIADIKGFSGHIGRDEILELLDGQEFKKGATLAITHGDDSRESLSVAIKDLGKKFSKDINIIIPSLKEQKKISL